MARLGTRLVAPLLLVAAAAALLVLTLPQEAEARDYWAAGLSTPYTAGPVTPNTIVSAIYHPSAPGAAPGTVQFWKAGLTPTAAQLVLPGSTGHFAFSEWYYQTQM